MAVAQIEAAVGALYARLQDQISGIKKFARIYIDPNSLQAEQQPALLLLANHYEQLNLGMGLGGHHMAKARGRPNVWSIHLDIVIYARTPTATDPTLLSPETQLNDFLAQIEACVNWQPSIDKYDPTNEVDMNLGGLISRGSIEGPVTFVAGAGAKQASMVIPVELLMPTS